MSTAITAATTTNSKLGDGCYHVFLDVGANIGIHGRFLFEPHLYPESLSAKLFAEQFGTKRDNRHFCVFAFELNPVHRERHLELERVYNSLGWRYVPMHAGVGDRDGTVTVDYVPEPDYKDWGFTVVNHQETPNETATKMELRIVRLSTFLTQEILDRKLPTFDDDEPTATISSKPAVPAKVLVKLDVEGMELLVIPDLLMTGALCKVADIIFGETHCTNEWFAFPMSHPNNPSHVLATSREDCTAYTESLRKLLNEWPHCEKQTKWLELDDETYLHDGQPLPEHYYTSGGSISE